MVLDDSSEQRTVSGHDTEATAALAVAAYALTVVEGGDLGATLSIDGTQPSRLLIGQSPVCNLKLTDVLVSRRHAAIARSDEGLRISDLDSTNGTFVNGVRIFEAVLRAGDFVTIGETTIRVDARGECTPVLSSEDHFGPLFGASVVMRRLYPLCEALARSDVPVVIEGETGTGKEVTAEAIHDASARKNGPFVVFDCTAVPPTLVESELFGHVRGAFTGAVSTRAGVFEQANGGTLFIDEIGDLDLAMQPKLLRALERSEVRPVGGSQWTRVDVRILAATRRDLDREVQDGRFRDDLFYRLAVARVELPPLRARKGDIPLLTKRLWKELGGTSEPSYELLRRFERLPWYGNVRELANAVARAIALGGVQSPEAGDAEWPVAIGRYDPELLSLPFARARDQVLADFERQYVDSALARHSGSVTRAAEGAGISRRYFTTLATRQRR